MTAPIKVRCHGCDQVFPLRPDEAHRLRSIWERDGTRRTILCPACTHAWPRPAARDQVKNTRARWKRDKNRRRQHGIGDHSMCLPQNCDELGTVTDIVTRDVTRHIGTGRDGTGKALPASAEDVS